jgi:hypothetical protein
LVQSRGNLTVTRSLKGGGFRRPPTIRGGAVCFPQRFGGSLDLNVHYHVLSRTRARVVAARQVNHAMRRGRFDPNCLRYAAPTRKTSLEALRAMGDIARVRRSLELYRAQPEFRAPSHFAKHVRSLINGARSLTQS